MNLYLTGHLRYLKFLIPIYCKSYIEDRFRSTILSFVAILFALFGELKSSSFLTNFSLLNNSIISVGSLLGINNMENLFVIQLFACSLICSLFLFLLLVLLYSLFKALKIIIKYNDYIITQKNSTNQLIELLYNFYNKNQINFVKLKTQDQILLLHLYNLRIIK